MDEMQAYREGIMRGYPSMRGRREAAPAKPAHTSVDALPKMPRPYGMPDDHPDVVGGKYA